MIKHSLRRVLENIKNSIISRSDSCKLGDDGVTRRIHEYVTRNIEDIIRAYI